MAGRGSRRAVVALVSVLVVSSACGAAESDAACAAVVIVADQEYDGYETSSPVPAGPRLEERAERPECDDGELSEAEDVVARRVVGVDPMDAIVVDGEPTALYVARGTPLEVLPSEVRALVGDG